jgi:hypothetical protein
MTTDDAVIRALVSRIEDLEHRLDEVQRNQVAWKVRTAHLQGAFPRQSPDGVFRYSQPLVTVGLPR